MAPLFQVWEPGTLVRCSCPSLSCHQMYLLYGSLSDSINNANSYRALTQPGRKDRPL